LPTPPNSDRGKIKVPQKRKRAPKDLGPNKKAKKIIRIRKVSKNQPCCLCPNDFSWEELLPTSHGQRAHRTCAMYTSETYIAHKDGKDMVYNVENVSKARLELKCYECRQKKGSCFQCSSAKCTKSYHATCAMQAGVQVDKGEISVWHEGVEYRDIGFDWRCRLHRTVKRTRITSELSACNHANGWWQNPEFRRFLFNLKEDDLIQFQATNSDDIEAGLVIAPYDEGQDAVLVKILPDLKVVKEVDPTTILFVDSATSCLQKPSANALDLPEDLQGMTASLPESTEKKPSPGDPFTETPRTEWAEFVSAEPPLNKGQKPIDLSKEKQVWLYLGESSSEAKAQYTADPANPVYDPASNFLNSVTPPKPVMAPPPQPKRQSLAASYPVSNAAAAARKAAITASRPNSFTMATTPSTVPGTFSGTTQNLTNSGGQDQSSNVQQPTPLKPSQYRDLVTGQEARLNQQARILQRQQAKAQQLDAADRVNTITPSSIGIDHDAVQRQRQFQQEASQHAKHMKEWSKDPSLPPLKQYDQFPNFHPMDTPGRYGGPAMMQSNIRPQQYQYSNDWMSAGAGTHNNGFGASQNTGMNSMLTPHFNRPQSPSVSNATTPFPAYVPQPHIPFPYQSHSSPDPGSIGIGGAYAAPRLENIRAAANQPPPPPPSAEVERQRRISNPAYPFKSPDQIKAQKEAEKNSPPGSRPSSSYMLPSPRLQHDGYMNSSSSASPVQPLDPQNPPQFINPNATQISHPGSSTGHRSTRGSFSGFGTPTSTTPPVPAGLRKSQSVDMTFDMIPFHSQSLSLDHRYPPKRSLYDPLSSAAAFPQSKPQPAEPPMAPASRQLIESLEKRPMGPNASLQLNDRAVPKQLLDWQVRGGFWGRVAGYFIQKHQTAAMVYKSPFMAMDSQGSDGTLAERYYNSLEPEQRVRIDNFRQGKSE
jgi:hypothetical protein